VTDSLTGRQPAHVYRRRRLVALAALLAVVALVWAGVAALAGGGDEPPASRVATSRPAAPPQLPRGGRSVFPRFRVVAYYGAPQSHELGELGIGTPASATARLERQAKAYARPGRPVLPALELIAVIANADSGDDGRYSTRQSDATIGRYLRAARRAKALLLLDIQPGRSDFFTETTRLRKWLKKPDVGLAIDAEWRVDAPEIPGQVIGHVGSREINATTAWLSQLTLRRRLPQKLVIIHHFTDDMVPVSALKRAPGLAYVLNADGFGSDAVKIEKYHRFAREAPRGFYQGFKLFYHEDVSTMRPREVMHLHPRPDVVVYE
jgi:hypothetical protein